MIKKVYKKCRNCKSSVKFVFDGKFKDNILRCPLCGKCEYEVCYNPISPGTFPVLKKRSRMASREAYIVLLVDEKGKASLDLILVDDKEAMREILNLLAANSKRYKIARSTFKTNGKWGVIDLLTNTTITNSEMLGFTIDEVYRMLLNYKGVKVLPVF
jgi:hypothetical protein